MKIKINDLLKIVLAVSAMLIAISVAFYFLWSLPHRNSIKINTELDIQRQQQQAETEKIAEERKLKKQTVAKEVRDECIEKGRAITSSFGLDNTYKSPMFSPYIKVSSFNNNERLITAMSVYSSCLKVDPRNDSNHILDDFVAQANIAAASVKSWNSFIVTVMPDICESSLIAISSKRDCDLANFDEDLRLWAKENVEYNNANGEEITTIEDEIKARKEQFEEVKSSYENNN